MLETGKWPLTAEQTACIRQSAEASEAFGNYLAASLVLGSVLAYGDSNITASLLASPDAKAVLQLPVSRIGADYQAWFEAAAQQCSLPRYQLPNSTDAALGWWASLRCDGLPSMLLACWVAAPVQLQHHALPSHTTSLANLC